MPNREEETEYLKMKVSGGCRFISEWKMNLDHIRRSFQPLIPVTAAMALTPMPVATTAARMAKAFCNPGPVK